MVAQIPDLFTKAMAALEVWGRSSTRLISKEASIQWKTAKGHVEGAKARVRSKGKARTTTRARATIGRIPNFATTVHIARDVDMEDAHSRGGNRYHSIREQGDMMLVMKAARAARDSRRKAGLLIEYVILQPVSQIRLAADMAMQIRLQRDHIQLIPDTAMQTCLPRDEIRIYHQTRLCRVVC